MTQLRAARIVALGTMMLALVYGELLVATVMAAALLYTKGNR
jgi:hypothetical protein